MFNHQYNFSIDLPESLIEEGLHTELNESSLEGKVLIGLCGYGKSGKDAIAKSFIGDYEFHRVAFADNIKHQMNEHLREVVCKDINENESKEVEAMRDCGTLVDWQPFSVEDIDFLTEDLDLKRVLRPYIIWYAEKIREINGSYYWINLALENDAKGYDKIILSDVRRPAELDLFSNSNVYRNKIQDSFLFAGIGQAIQGEPRSFSSLLFYANQLGLTDGDVLTHETITIARENWMFAGTFYINPQIPEDRDYRARAIKTQVDRFCKHYKIKASETIEGHRQTSIFDNKL